MNKRLLLSIFLSFFIFLFGILAKEGVAEQKQTDVDKTKIVEEWQINPEAFAKLFFGDDLSRRSPRKEITSLRLTKKSIFEKVKGSYVVWPVTFGISPTWLAASEGKRREMGFSNLGLYYFIGSELSGWIDITGGSRREGTEVITWKQMTWGIPPQSSVLLKMKLEIFSASIHASGMLLILVVGASEVEIETLSKKCDWPEYTSEIPWAPFHSNLPMLAQNSYEVLVTSESEFMIKVGLRSDDKGTDFIVPKKGTASIRVPRGKYDIYFQYAANPESLYQGESLDVGGSSSGVKVQLKSGGEGYKLRKIK